MVPPSFLTPLRRLFALLSLAVVLAGPAAALAADSDSADTRDLERLVSTLEDESARARLVGQLKSLIAAQKEIDPAPEETLLGRLSDQIGAFGDQVMEAVDSIRDAPELAAAVGQRLADQLTRQRMGQILTMLGVILAAGIIADRIVAFAIRRWHKAHPPGPVMPGAAPALHALAGRLVRDLAPLAAFGLGAWAAIWQLELKGNGIVAAQTVIVAYVSVRLVNVATQLVLSSRSPLRRLVSFDDETAEYIKIWVQRVTVVGVFGPLAASAPRLLGMPAGAAFLTLKVIGLAMTALVVIFILQNRRVVAGLLRRGSDEPMFGQHVQMLRTRLADIWHVLAILWVVAIYLVWAVQVKGGFEFMLRATILTLVILVVAGLVASLLRRLIERGFAVSQEVRERYPLLEARANRYLPVMHLLLRGTVAAITILALAQTWGLQSLKLLTSPAGRQVLSSAISITLVLVIALVLWEVFSSAIERYLSATDSEGNQLQRSGRARTLLPLARNVVMGVLVIAATLIVLSELGVNIAPLLAGAGVLGIAIGFGSQKLVQDIITGAFILFEDTIAVGDVVKIGEHSGVVEAISIRAIRLRDVQGSVHTIPFGAVTTAINLTKGFNYALFDIGVSYSADCDRVGEVLSEIAAEMRTEPRWQNAIIDPMEVQGIDRFDASSVVIRARLKTVPSEKWAVMREFHRRLKKRFEAEGIEIPFPQQQIWIGRQDVAEAPAALPAASMPPAR